MIALMTPWKPFALSVARAASEVEASLRRTFRLRPCGAMLKANGISAKVRA